ncbi:MAG: PaaI family thioesterase [Leptospirales bacterium]|jgi:uncharacterized protein (TIGR00369 family)
MQAYDMIRKMIPKDLFTFKEDATYIEQAQHLISQCHPAATAMRLVSLGGETAEAEIPYAQSNRALHGLMHGGCYFTVGDTITALMSFYHVENEAETTLTMGASIRYLRPIRNDTVRAVARLKSKAGKRLNFVCDFYNEANQRAAQAKYQYVLAQPGQ